MDHPSPQHGRSDARLAAEARQLLLDRFEILATDSADIAHEVLAKIFAPHALDIRDGKIATRMHFATLPAIGIATLNYGASVRVETQLSTWFAVIRALTGEVSARSPGDRASTAGGDFLVLSPTDQLSIEFSPDTTALIVKIDRIAMERAAVNMTSAQMVAPLVFDMHMNRTSPSAQTFWSVAELMLRELTTPDSALGNERVSMHLEQTLLQTLLHAQPFGSDAPMSGRTLIAPRHLKIAENYMATHADEPLTIAEVCRVTGVSRRTLHEAFRTYRGTSPMVYLKNIRLERVRVDLLRTQGNVSVTDVAMKWHFYQLGRFAGEYRRRFGEKPSDTQRFAKGGDFDAPRAK